MSKIYISYPIVNSEITKSLSDIVAYLQSLGHKVYTPNHLLAGEGISEMKDVLRASDLLLVILTNEDKNSLFELGYAVGRGKKVLIITGEEVDIYAKIKDLPLIVGDILSPEIHKKIIRAIQELIKPKDENTNQFILNLYLIEKFLDVYGQQDISNSFEENLICNFSKKTKKEISKKYYLYEDENKMSIFKNLDINYESILPSFYEKIINTILNKNYKTSLNYNEYKDYDLIINNYKKYKKTLVEIKTLNSSCYMSTNNILKFYHTIKENNADCGIIITNSNYSTTAREFCKNKKNPHIYLWTFDNLLENTNIQKYTYDTMKNFMLCLLKNKQMELNTDQNDFENDTNIKNALEMIKKIMDNYEGYE